MVEPPRFSPLAPSGRHPLQVPARSASSLGISNRSLCPTDASSTAPSVLFHMRRPTRAASRGCCWRPSSSWSSSSRPRGARRPSNWLKRPRARRAPISAASNSCVPSSATASRSSTRARTRCRWRTVSGRFRSQRSGGDRGRRPQCALRASRDVKARRGVSVRPSRSRSISCLRVRPGRGLRCGSC